MTDLAQDGRARALRALPRVDAMLATPTVAALLEEAPRRLVADAVRSCLDEERDRIKTGLPAAAPADLEARCRAAAERAVRYHLECAVNATGVVVHTNLGRAPLSPSAAAHVADVASHYSTLEFDLANGHRGSRHGLVEELLIELTGAEAAAVVNNNAAAVMIVLSELARGREVVVSRGELIEIGGSFRIPDIMALSGARMVEVGTTNKTHLADFERAITDETALVLKVHPSNYRVVGFHEEVAPDELARMAHERGVAVFEDQGSGVLVDLRRAGLGQTEHTPGWSLAQGVDVVSCSGDKLLGGTQAGIILGSSEMISRIKKNPLMRAVRPDKLTLAGIEATLRDYLDPETAWERIPVLRMLGTPEGELRQKALAVLARVSEASGALAGVDPEGGAADGSWSAGPVKMTIAPDVACVGGGALPTSELPTWTVRVSAPVEAERMRMHLIGRRARPVVCRVHKGDLVCDMRTLVDARDEDDLVEALVELVAWVLGDGGATACQGGGR